MSRISLKKVWRFGWDHPKKLKCQTGWGLVVIKPSQRLGSRISLKKFRHFKWDQAKRQNDLNNKKNISLLSTGFCLAEASKKPLLRRTQDLGQPFFSPLSTFRNKEFPQSALKQALIDAFYYHVRVNDRHRSEIFFLLLFFLGSDCVAPNNERQMWRKSCCQPTPLSKKTLSMVSNRNV